MTQIDEIKSNYSYDTGVQFSVPKDMYFDINTLKEILGPKKEDSCKLNDAFTNIYDERQFLGEWKDTSIAERDIEYTSGYNQGSSKCIRVNFTNWSMFQFFNRIEPETKRYKSIEFYMKTENEFNNCLNIKIGDKNSTKISTNAAGTWEKKVLKLSDLGVKEEEKSYFKEVKKRHKLCILMI